MEAEISALWKFVDQHRGESSPEKLILEYLLQNNSVDVTSDLIFKLSQSFGTKFLNSYVSYPPLIDFIVKLLKNKTANSILDPVCGSGLLLKSLSDRYKAKIVHGIEINVDTAKLTEKLLGNKAKVFTASCFDKQLPIENSYDLIVGEPPFGMRYQRNEDHVQPGNKLNGDFSDILAYWVCSKLSPSGVAILILPGSFIWKKQSDRIKDAITNDGFCIKACIQVPGGLIQGSGMEAYVVVIERGVQDSVFVGQFSENKGHQKVLIENYYKMREGKQPEQGRLCEWRTLKGFKQISASERMKKLAKKRGLLAVRMKEIVTSAVKTNKRDFEKLDSLPNSLFLPMVGRSRAVFQQDELSDKLKDYVRLVVDSDRVNVNYFVHLLNSELGQLLLDSVRIGSTIPRFNLNDLLDLDVYLPPYECQVEVVDTQKRINSIRNELAEIEIELWNSPSDVENLSRQVCAINQVDRFEDWVDSIPFPLASIIWRSKTQPGTIKDQYETLVHFFEALAEFMATIHLSAFSSNTDLWAEHRDRLFNKLKEQNLSLDRASFGSWKLIVEYLGARARKLSNNNYDLCRSIYSVQSEEVLSALFNSTLLEVLQKANKIRNDWKGHIGAIGDSKAKEIHGELIDLVQVYRGVVNRAWNSYELISPMSNEFYGGMYHYKVRRVMGTRTPFEIVNYESVQVLDRDFLFLFDSSASSGLQLIPLIKLMNSPATETNACYFYSKKVGEQHRYVSYHFEAESDKVDYFSDTAAALSRLKQIEL